MYLWWTIIESYVDFFCEIKTVKFLQGALVPASTGPPNGSGPQQGQIRSAIDMVRVYNYGPQSLQQQPPQTNPIMVLKKLLPFPFFLQTYSIVLILKKEFPVLESEIRSLQLLFWSEFCSNCGRIRCWSAFSVRKAKIYLFTFLVRKTDHHCIFQECQ